MRKTTIIALSFGVVMALILACSSDKGTNGNQGVVVTITPHRALITLDSTFQFSASLSGTPIQEVIWQVHDSTGGYGPYGTIDTTGFYTAPSAVPDGDSVKISAISIADSTRSGTAWAVLRDPNKIYVAANGSDANGNGSKWQPFRSITKALRVAYPNPYHSMTIIVGAGNYTTGSGETFPLRVMSFTTLQGAGKDSTHVIGPANAINLGDTVIVMDGDVITVEMLQIATEDSNGVGVFMRAGNMMDLTRNLVGPNGVGVQLVGQRGVWPVIDGNDIIRNDKGIVADSSSKPTIRGCLISRCRTYGVEILDDSAPNLGDTLAIGNGQNTITDCGVGNFWLIYNLSPQSIWAVGNTWPFLNPSSNDQFIFDDEENATSGEVILVAP